MACRQELHLKAPGNWINDPNGFIYYKGQYHLFYQHFPYAPVWGTMHWGHAVSSDLVHWEHQDIALFPTKDYDRNGVFSGSAIEKDGKLYLYYSAVKYLKADKENIHCALEDNFETSQAMLVSEDGKRFDNWNGKKQIIPVLHKEEMGNAVHTRDPKVWKEGERYYMVLGSTFQKQTGRILFFTSADGETWEYENQYQDSRFGTILECPDIFNLSDTYVFLGSPMEILKDGYEYAAQSVWALGDFDSESCGFALQTDSHYIDYGLDLYAPQTNVDKDGRRVMIGWIRMPKPVEPVDGKPWNGMMSLPRVVEQVKGHLYFRVHPQVETYFTEELSGTENISYEEPLRIQTELQEGEFLDIGGFVIRMEQGCVKTDRSKVFGELEGYRMESCTPALDGSCQLDIFTDSHLIEIFVNKGEYVISNVVYELQSHLKGKDLKKMQIFRHCIAEEFVVQ